MDTDSVVYYAYLEKIMSKITRIGGPIRTSATVSTTDKMPITHTFCACHDGGFDTNKGMGVDVSEMSSDNIGALQESIVTNQFSARMAPIDGIPSDAEGRILISPIEGISGHDAILLQPGLWTSELTADHYQSSAYQQYLFQNLADLFQQAHILSGSHVGVFLSLGLNIMHYHHAESIKTSLMNASALPILIELATHQKWYVTFQHIEIKEQPFWVLIDQLMRFDEHGVLQAPDISQLQSYYVVLDFGSNTFQGMAFIKNLIPIDQGFCEGIGSWDILKRQFKPIVLHKAKELGIDLGDPKMQKLMEAYKTGYYRVGKHEPLDLRQEKERMIVQKIEQRLKTAKLYLRFSDEIGTIVCAGGDAEVNFPRFLQEFESEITGDMRLAIDDNSKEEVVFRLASGGLKGAIRRWLASVTEVS